MTLKLTYEEFFTKAILNLRDLTKSKGIHTVFSGFNKAFRDYYSCDPIPVTQELAKKGLIDLKPVKGGVMIYLSGEGPQKSKNQPDILNKILNTPEKNERSLIDDVISNLEKGGLKKFPQDFLCGKINKSNSIEILLPGTELQFEANSQTTIISPRRHFKYEAKNPPIAKYIIYSSFLGQKVVNIPKDNKSTFSAVIQYEQYCKNLKNEIFQTILDKTNNETVAENLTGFIVKELKLKPLLITK